MSKATANGRPIPAAHSGGYGTKNALHHVSTEYHLRLHYLQNRHGLTKAQAVTLAGLVWGRCHD